MKDSDSAFPVFYSENPEFHKKELYSEDLW
jgi:hypothetical protein